VHANRPHCLGILRLYRGVDPERAETAFARAVAIGALTYKSVASRVQSCFHPMREAYRSASRRDR
jgi:hypothetical protein